MKELMVLALLLVGCSGTEESEKRYLFNVSCLGWVPFYVVGHGQHHDGFYEIASEGKGKWLIPIDKCIVNFAPVGESHE